MEQVLEDFVLDRASFRSDRARELLERTSYAGFPELRAAIQYAVEFLGGQLTEHELGGEQITLAPRLASDLKVSQVLHRGVFDPKLAVRLDDLPFLACGHPLIDRILQLMTQLREAGIGARRSPSAPPGLSLEFVWSMSATLVVTEARLVRHLVRSDGTLTSGPYEFFPDKDTPIAAVADADFASEAIARSRGQFGIELRAFRDEMRGASEELRARKLRRLERVQRSVLERDDARISDELAFVERAESSMDSRLLKILPARRAKLEKHRARRLQHVSEYERQVEDLQQQGLDVRGELFAVSILIGD